MCSSYVPSSKSDQFLTISPYVQLGKIIKQKKLVVYLELATLAIELEFNQHYFYLLGKCKLAVRTLSNTRISEL